MMVPVRVYVLVDATGGLLDGPFRTAAAAEAALLALTLAGTPGTIQVLLRARCHACGLPWTVLDGALNQHPCGALWDTRPLGMQANPPADDV